MDQQDINTANRIDQRTIASAGSRAAWVAVAIGFTLGAPAWAVEIDGRIDPQEWAGAQHVTEFRKILPLNGEPASLPTEAWILSTPNGLAIAFRNTQPPSVPRTNQRVSRDFDAQVDRINVAIDFEGDGRTAYNFTVSSTGGIYDAIITNEFVFNADWDGNWQYAVGEDEQTWTVELLIPWHIAPMRDVRGETRTLKIYLDRVIGSTGERVAWPFASQDRSRFVSDFSAIEVANHNQALLAFTPYVSSLYDNVDRSNDVDVGADLFWKPNGKFQLSATLNPDFGQVESDDLVVNFDATEIFISDKRPFFTENQGIFEFTTPSDYSQLFYTRRVGGPRDDGLGAGDITAAIKLNGSFGATKYAVFGADEGAHVGRKFGALRVVHDFASQNLGMLLTHVERPYLDREATVLGVDHNWRPTSRWNVRTRLIGSRIEEAAENARDFGATIWADYEMDDGWRQQFIGMHFGDELEVNDMGYLVRNSVNYAHYQVQKRFTDLPESSRYASKDWRWRVVSYHNNSGERLRYQFRTSRESQLRNGAYEYVNLHINSSGVDDLVTRGNGNVNIPPNFDAYGLYERPRKGNWSYELEGEVFTGGLAGNDKIGLSVYFEPTYFISDSFSTYVGFYGSHTPDWLIWQYDNLVGSFDGRELNFNMGFNWTITDRQELRLKLQGIGIDADLRSSYRIDGDGRAIQSLDPVEDFSVRMLAVQLRYRYEIAPLSYLYLVYGRGGYDEQLDMGDPDARRMLRRSFSLRDDEQFMVKFSYRFEL
jgi:hypothetical protein